MLDLNQIASFYPQGLRIFKRSILREYLQYKILEAIFDSEYGVKLSFMGGTAIHIIHQNDRFSEELDFDNLGLKEKDFIRLADVISKKLKLEGYKLDARNVFKGAYHCYIKFFDVLFDNGLSPHKEEKLLIQIDAEPQNFNYPGDKVILNKFDVFTHINVVPQDILLAQKICAIFKRKRAMARDFYDAVFLFGKIKPNFKYLKFKLEIENMVILKKRLLSRCKELNFKHLAKDTEPFLFNPCDSKKVVFFCDYIKEL